MVCCCLIVFVSVCKKNNNEIVLKREPPTHTKGGVSVYELLHEDRCMYMCSREARGPTTMLFTFEGGDAQSSIIRRRTKRPRRDVDLDKFSQVLRGSATDDFSDSRDKLFCI